MLVLLPGLTGGSHDSYVAHMARAAAEAGIRPVVFNSRGTSDAPVTSPQFYSASYTDDLRHVSTPHFLHMYPITPPPLVALLKLPRPSLRPEQARAGACEREVAGCTPACCGVVPRRQHLA